VKASRINAEFDQRVALPPPRAEDWVASPMAGVTRRMLDRVGDEVARATSLVRYAPASRFERHEQGGGEEILVLEGLFQDEFGAYPAGSWLRNPRWSRHTPFTGPEGALIYVKTGHLGAELLGPDDSGKSR
jgi:anti-sigma factor ChrR (cupin superfamily)